MSSASRASTCSAIAIACRLVSDAANLQPALPVQATRPARTAVAFAARPSASISRLTASTCVSGMSEISRFCQTVRRIVAAAVLVGDRRPARASAPPSSGRPAARRRPSRGPAASAGGSRCAPARSTGRRGSHAFGETRDELAAELVLDSLRNFSKPQRVEHVLQPRLLAVGPVAVVDEDADDRRRRPPRIRRARGARRCRARNPCAR